MFRQLQRAAVVLSILPCIAAGKSGISQVTGIRSWSHTDSTRVIIETTGPVEYKADRAINPDRLFFDLLRAQPWLEHRRYGSRIINDRLVRRVRIAETAPGTTRIVFDLTGPGTFRVSRLEAPHRIVIEIRPPVPGTGTFVYPPRQISSAPRPRIVLLATTPPMLDPPPLFPPYLPDVTRALVAVRPASRLIRRSSSDSTTATASNPRANTTPVIAKISAPPHPLSYDATPRASENGSHSLTRALGLKVNRVVIDAGHGGHDEGTTGPNGVLEKDVVLDVALRVAKLVQSRMGAEVVLTRSDDTFIPLQERTAIANSRRADLFLSIHANSSPSPAVAGTETFFLNFTNSPGALDVAARENSGADKSVGELRDLIQSITLNDKIAESQTFAQAVQNSISMQAAKSNLTAKNRGVKRAPFVVLIGASMPSVLAEIGFLTNPRDEANLAKPEYRQKIAEALYKGLSQYSQSLSHFDLARGLGKGVDKSEKTIVGLN
ncbi:MAG: N-acetylmuramoyl-L-alanine amidase [Bryobacterales bacterium]|jgi:N-acetylmuramoyl-L-alanine amidase|nr:N-acetylmuramoyl-L-alanine amidase [Bryobacterales bacterium]